MAALSVATTTVGGDGGGEAPASPHHVFSPRQRGGVVWLVSWAAMFSGLSANIYFPALEEVAKDMHVTYSTVLSSITIFLVLQGVSPSFWGPLSDVYGRRVIFVGTFACYVLANLGLLLSRSFPVLLFFRALQATGAATTIAISCGVITDISTSTTRGGYMGKNQMIRTTAQALGPAIGGALTLKTGYHNIFALLLAMGLGTLLLILIFLPETHRCIAGNGSVPLHGPHKPWVYSLRGQPHADASAERTPRPRLRPAAFLAPLRMLGQPTFAVSLFVGAYVFAVQSVALAVAARMLRLRYGYNVLEIGLCFLPNGLGCMIASLLHGQLLDTAFRAHEATYRAHHKLPLTIPITPTSAPSFPFERARLSIAPLILLSFALATGLYGFAFRGPLYWVLVCSFVMGAAQAMMLTVTGTLLVDVAPEEAASATAANNLARCALGAVATAVAERFVERLGIAGAFGTLAGGVVAVTPLLGVVWRWGPGWRVQRARRRERRREVEEGKRGVRSRADSGVSRVDVRDGEGEVVVEPKTEGEVVVETRREV
ncbi:MFS general substrate transporter [Trichodelitschia bisporula]|uniref:MFS general substrate transporter n=1 Tax=Trichodelitschia bisporula TaxID=703511 RepID=A0A6G1HPX2_9PEZI|nr:MFS general substrate transporter [Trichodelitschia bisporula]